MDLLTIALFGEAEKGEFTKGYICDSLMQLLDCFGNPPAESRGLYFAIQALHYNHPLIFFRVQEEGFSTPDYMNGLTLLEKSPFINKITAICAPGVGDSQIINAVSTICQCHNHLLITNESDFYDYLSQ